MIGWTELLAIFCVVLLLFGAKRIPELARSLGRASREFKNARDGIVDDLAGKKTNRKESGDGEDGKPEA